MSFKLYNYVLSADCYKVRLMAALLEVKYDTVNIDFYPGKEHLSPTMLALNPAGSIPILQTDELILTEPQAMLTWLAKQFDETGTWFPTQDANTITTIMQWLGFSATLSTTIGAARLHRMLHIETDLKNALASATTALRQLECQLFEQSLVQSQWLVGNTPSIADIACFPFVALSADANIELDNYPAIRAWVVAIKRLDGFITMPGIFELHENTTTPSKLEAASS